MEKLYILSICEGEEGAEKVKAFLTPEQAEKIKKDIKGELNTENLISLVDGRIIDTGIIDDIKTPLEEAKNYNLIIFNNWKACGQPEACEELNDSNRELIKAFAEEFPAAMGLKINVYTEEERKRSGIFKITEAEHLYNFCCDFIFNGTAENFEEVKAAAEEWRKNGKISDLNKLYRVLEESNGVCMVWS